MNALNALIVGILERCVGSEKRFGPKSDRICALRYFVLDAVSTGMIKNPITTETENESVEEVENRLRANPPVNMTVAEAKVYMCVSIRTVRSLLSNGDIPYTRVTSKPFGRGRIIIRRQDIDDYLERNAK